VIILGGVFQAAYGSLMTLSGLGHGIFIDKQDAAVPPARSSTAITCGLPGNVSRAGVGLMLAELSSTRAAGWRDSARELLRTLLGNKARVRLALVVMVTGLVVTRSRMGNVAFVASLTGRGLFSTCWPCASSQAARSPSRQPAVIDLLVVGNFFGIEKVAERFQQASIEARSV